MNNSKLPRHVYGARRAVIESAAELQGNATAPNKTDKAAAKAKREIETMIALKNLTSTMTDLKAVVDRQAEIAANVRENCDSQVLHKTQLNVLDAMRAEANKDNLSDTTAAALLMALKANPDRETHNALKAKGLVTADGLPTIKGENLLRDNQRRASDLLQTIGAIAHTDAKKDLQ